LIVGNPIFDESKAGDANQDATGVAKSGYAVGSVEVCSDTVAIIALRITFVRVKDGSRVPSDTYQSPWIGETDGGEMHALPANGETVVGIFGRHGLNLDAMELVVLDSKKSSK
jgi:hypothetical protein